MRTQPLNESNVKERLAQSMYKVLVKPQHACTTYTLLELIEILIRSREWFDREYGTHTLHPAIKALLGGDAYVEYREYITDWCGMVLEWPHVSKDDPTKLAYTQDDDKGQRDIQTRTSLGKYIKRHCPTMPDHMLRDFVALFSGADNEFSFVHTMDEMLEVVNTGPKSCMADPEGDDWDETDHPYNVYLPQYGWHMAVRRVNGRVDGRCMCLTQSDKDKYYVRTYKRNLEDPDNGYSYADEALEAWLEQQGYTKRGSWPDGAQLAKLTNPHGGYIMPYLDGDDKQVRERSGCFEIHYRGEYRADDTNGLLEIRDTVSCDDCGQEHDPEDSTGVGYYGEGAVCPSCIENRYVLAYGRSREQYYVHIDNAIWVGGSHAEYYDEEYIGNYEICWCEDIEDYLHIDDAWRCEATGNWYSDSEDYVLIDDQKYHPDNAPEVEDEDESEQEDISN